MPDMVGMLRGEAKVWDELEKRGMPALMGSMILKSGYRPFLTLLRVKVDLTEDAKRIYEKLLEVV